MKIELAKLIPILTLIFLLLFGVNPASCNIIFIHDGHELTAAIAPYIMSPSSQTYTSGWLTLYVNFKGWIFGNVWFSMNYSLDGNDNQTVPLKDHYFGFFPQTGGHPEKNYWDASAELPVLSNGSHWLTVYLECRWDTYDSSGTHTHEGFDSQTVYFSIRSPIMLLLENQTYKTDAIPLNFYANEQVSQIAYSIDNQSNVTTSGNSTLSGLAEGVHSINVYAADAQGHWVYFDAAKFAIVKPATSTTFSPMLLLFISLIIVVIALMFILVFFRRIRAENKQSFL